MITAVVHLFIKSAPWLMHGEDKKDCVVMYENTKRKEQIRSRGIQRKCKIRE